MVSGRGLAGRSATTTAGLPLCRCTLLLVANVSTSARIWGHGRCGGDAVGVPSLCSYRLRVSILAGTVYTSYPTFPRREVVTAVLFATSSRVPGASRLEGRAGGALIPPPGTASPHHARRHPGYDHLAVPLFWQASQEVEEERRAGPDARQRRGATEHELDDARLDVTSACVSRTWSCLHHADDRGHALRAVSTTSSRAPGGEACVRCRGRGILLFALA